MHSRRAPGKLAADSYLKATAAVASPPTLFRDGRLKLDHGGGGVDREIQRNLLPICHSGSLGFRNQAPVGCDGTGLVLCTKHRKGS